MKTPAKAQPPRYRDAIWLVDWGRIGETFRFAGQTWRLGDRDMRVLSFLHRLDKTDWPLVRLRASFREILRDKPVAGLVDAMSMSEGSIRQRMIAAWLLGHCGEKRAVGAIRELAEHSDPALRKAAAHALRRLGARLDLELMAAQETDPRVLRAARLAPPKPFAQRLTSFVARDVTPTGAPPAAAQPLWLFRPLWEYHPPRRAEWMRTLLERLRRLVHGM